MHFLRNERYHLSRYVFDSLVYFLSSYAGTFELIATFR